MATGEEAIAIIKKFNSEPAIKNAFGSLGGYLAYLENPEQHRLKVIDQNGQISVIKNTNRQLGAQAALDIVKAWQTDPAVRAEFPSLNSYRCYVEAAMTGKVHIIGSK